MCKEFSDVLSCTCVVGPVEQLPDYNRLRSGMYQLRV